MEGTESLWLALALGHRQRLDFADEAGLLEREVSKILPGSPAEEAAERFAAEEDVSLGLELVRLLDAERGRTDFLTRPKLAGLSEFAQLLCACLGDVRSAAAVATDLLALANGKGSDEDVARRTLTTAAIGWLAAATRMEAFVGSPNPPSDAVGWGYLIIQEYESAALRRLGDSKAQASGKQTKRRAGPDVPDLRGLTVEESAAAINAFAEAQAAAHPDAPEELVVVSGIAASGSKDVGGDFDLINGKPLPLVKVPDLVSVRASLVAEFPHAETVVDDILGELGGKRSVRLRPVLLLGKPGCGKSRLARRLCEELGLPAVTYPCGGVGDSSIAGTARRWSSSEPSLPMKLVRDREVANPAVILDELDKAAEGNSNNGGRLWDALIQILERETAKAWLDPYIDAPVNLSAVNWLATANDLRKVPDPLIDRLRVLRLPEPTREHLPALASSMLDDILRERDIDHRWAEALNAIEVEALRKAWRGGSLRALRRYLEGVLDARDLSAPRH